jgi:hypothetical protein
MMKTIAAMAVALGLTATPVLAAEQASTGPVKLADGELDQVTAGDGSLLNLNLNLDVLLKNIVVTVNVSNVPINAAVAVQANALGQAIQNATVLAGQQVTQAQSLPILH